MIHSYSHKLWASAARGIATLLVVSLSIAVHSQGISADTDNDGIDNILDNCSQVANALQVDADGDGFGNYCDADMNNDLIINFIDYAMFTPLFLSSDPVADFNSDGVVNFLDVNIFAGLFLQRPGPSGVVASGFSVSSDRLYADLVLGGLLHMKMAPGQTDRWYGVQRQGAVVSFLSDGSSTELTPVLDISSSVSTNFEGGALGIAFDPNFALNGFLYISYTAPGGAGVSLISRISRFETTIDSEGFAVADASSEVIVLSVNQPFANHNGGDLAFGPDGYLYWGLGDGGSSGDPQRNGQDLKNLLSTIVRLDVNVTAADIDSGITYFIPPTNPFSANVDCTVACPEIFAWGLRNPFRWSFDSVSGALWAGDVGQDAIEEISVIENGRNYGWRCYEGNQVFSTVGCDLTQDFAEPMHTYTHSLGYSVTGGNVYRGSAAPDFQGMYIYADYGSGDFWGIYNGDYAGSLLNTSHSPVAFTEDADGELYYLSYGFSGSARVYKISITN